MLNTIESINNVINNFIWGVPAMICIIGVGLYLSFGLHFLQICKFPYAIRVTIGRIFRKRNASDGAMTPFQAVCTALAATVGTGNIAGVAGAIAIGGPGAVFWMWISALLGMCTKFSEVTLAVHFREKNAVGDWVGSKVFSKELMQKYNIPTAEYKVFDNAEEAIEYIKERNEFPTVIKADGLALGKGVIIPENLDDAIAGVKEIMEDKIFGASGNNIVVEEFLTGPEVSVLAFTDGKCVKPMVSSMDHKRALDGDKGLNTGGMGTVSPNPYYTQEVANECMDKIFMPTINAMNNEGRTFKGCLYFGLMITPKGPKVIEYNCRFGDPETQVVLPRLKTDIVDIFEAIDNETLSDLDVEWSDDACACVIMASGGYPKSYPKGIEITGLSNGQLDGVTVYHAGTKLQDNKLVTSGGRVLGVTALGDTLEDALKKSYDAVEKIHFEGAHYRRDIGKRALEANK